MKHCHRAVNHLSGPVPLRKGLWVKKACWPAYSKIWPEVVGHPGTFGILHLAYYVLGHIKSFNGQLYTVVGWYGYWNAGRVLLWVSVTSAFVPCVRQQPFPSWSSVDLFLLSFCILFQICKSLCWIKSLNFMSCVNSETVTVCLSHVSNVMLISDVTDTTVLSLPAIWTQTTNLGCVLFINEWQWLHSWMDYLTSLPPQAQGPEGTPLDFSCKMSLKETCSTQKETPNDNKDS